MDAWDGDESIKQRAELLDLGCGTGGSLRSASRRFGVEGIGIEIREALVEKAQANGLAVFQADVTEMDPDDYPSVNYAVLDNVLEHLYSLDDVAEVLRSACRVARRLVYVRHPSFEDEEYLEQLGLKLYWCDWRRHRTHVLLEDYRRIAAEIGVPCIIQPVGRIVDSADDSILPLSAPPDQPRTDKTRDGIYEESKHGPKPFITFDQPVWYTFDILFVTGEGIPSVAYDKDPFVHRVRPWISWPGEAPAAPPSDDKDKKAKAPAPSPLADATVGRPSGGDDQPELQRAIDRLAGSGGGTVLLGPGTYRLGKPLVLRDRVGLLGTSLIGTRLAPLTAGLDAVVLVRGRKGDAVEGCSLESVTVDGSVDGAPSTKAGVVIKAPASYCVLRDVRIVEVAGTGLHVRGDAFERLCIERLFVEGCGGAGIVLDRSDCRSVFFAEVGVADVARDGADAAVSIGGRCHLSQVHVDAVPAGTIGIAFAPGADDATLSNYYVGGDVEPVRIDPGLKAVHLGTTAPPIEAGA